MMKKLMNYLQKLIQWEFSNVSRLESEALVRVRNEKAAEEMPPEIIEVNNENGHYLQMQIGGAAPIKMWTRGPGVWKSGKSGASLSSRKAVSPRESGGKMSEEVVPRDDASCLDASR